MKELEGKIAVVTGAANGIGRAIALALGEAGVHAVVADIQAAGAEKVAAELEGLGVQALPAVCDVSKPESVAALADLAYTRFGQVHVLRRIWA